MKVIQVNSMLRGSTGKICRGIKNLSSVETDITNDIYYFWGEDTSEGVKCSNIVLQKFYALKSRITGKYGFVSDINTLLLIRHLKKEKPDIIHLHNVHDHTVNLIPLFKYISKNDVKVIWTFHDCWAFTGYCSHFVISGCEKWRANCCDCPVYKEYSWFIDRSNYLFEKKKDLYMSLDLTIVTPSKWLSELVDKSFLSQSDIRVINNGIDLKVFNPRTSNFKSKYGIEDKKIVLGVAFNWNEKKGIDVFYRLDRELPDDCVIVLVGSNEMISNISNRVILIPRTNNQIELAEIYSAADVFVNPTREDTFPTVDMEAIACGTPVVSFNTGGTAEIVHSESGYVVDVDSFDELVSKVLLVLEDPGIYRENCLKVAKTFCQEEKFKEYSNLYLEFKK